MVSLTKILTILAGCYTASALYCTCSGATNEVCLATKQQNGGRGANIIVSPRRGCAVERAARDIFRTECKKAFPTIRDKDNRCVDKAPSGPPAAGDP